MHRSDNLTSLVGLPFDGLNRDRVAKEGGKRVECETMAQYMRMR